VALSASRFVCSAIAVITFSTSPISRLESPSLATVCWAAAASSVAACATRAASVEFDAISRMLTLICSAAAATVCTLRDISSAVAAALDDCSEVELALLAT
jgi:hypothetical protein